MSFRLRPETKQRMDREAAKSSRSVAQEVELRLEQTLRDQSLLQEILTLAYGDFNGALLYFLGNIFKHADIAARTFETFKFWRDDKDTSKAVENVLLSLLDALHPSGDVNDLRVANSEQFIWRAILEEASEEEWVAWRSHLREGRVGVRVELIEKWLREREEPLPIHSDFFKEATKHISISFDDQPNRGSEEQKK